MTAFFVRFGDLLHGFEIAVRGNRETRFDDVDAHLVEQFGNFEFFLERHGGARRLLAVAQCGVENSYGFAVLMPCSWLSFRLPLQDLNRFFASFP